MRILFILFIIILMIGIISIYLFSFSTNKKQERFVDVMKQKKTWIRIAIVTVSPFILYAVITILLVLMRGECFPAYYTQIHDKQYICYEDCYYVSITDNKEKCDIAKENVQGNWIEKGYVRGEKTQFPYLHYWVPGHFLDELLVSEDEEYLYIHVWAGIDSYSEVYQRVEE